MILGAKKNNNKIIIIIIIIIIIKYIYIIHVKLKGRIKKSQNLIWKWPDPLLILLLGFWTSLEKQEGKVSRDASAKGYLDMKFS